MHGPETSSSETALLAALRCGDEDAFSALVDSYGAAMHRVALTFVRSSAVADEVVQEAWLGALRGLDRFEGRSALRTWLLRIVANIARTHAVREARSVPFSSLELARDLSYCAGCSTYLDQMRETIRQTSMAPREESLPPALREEIVARFRTWKRD